MADIQKRGPHQWQARVRRRGNASHIKTFTSKADAATWAREIESEMELGTFRSRVEGESTTLSDAFGRYLREVTVNKKGKVQEENRIKRWQASALGARYLATIKGADMAKFRDDWREKGKAENTIRLELALISHLFETARREWRMEALQNPVRSITLPGSSEQRDRRLRDGEEFYLMAALDEAGHPAARPIVQFALETAMRQSEMLRLTWENIDADQRVAHLADTKNGTQRNVPLSTRALAILEELPADVKPFPFNQDWIVKAFARSCKAGAAKYLEDCYAKHKKPVKSFLEDLHFHDMRHEATTRLFERGLDIMEVAAITGHKSLAMLKRYTHLRAEDLAKKLL